MPTRVDDAGRPVRQGRENPREGKIFLNYRQSDTAGFAGRLDDALSARFGKDAVFRDIDDIAAGTDFPTVIDHALAECDVVLALIGRGWVSCTTEDGQQHRLDDPEDWVRMELEAALRRKITIIPVLVDKAKMPSAKALPTSLAPLASRQALEITDQRWSYDVGLLVERLEDVGSESGRVFHARRSRAPTANAATAAPGASVDGAPAYAGGGAGHDADRASPPGPVLPPAPPISSPASPYPPGGHQGSGSATRVVVAVLATALVVIVALMVVGLAASREPASTVDQAVVSGEATPAAVAPEATAAAAVTAWRTSANDVCTRMNTALRTIDVNSPDIARTIAQLSAATRSLRSNLAMLDPPATVKAKAGALLTTLDQLALTADRIGASYIRGDALTYSAAVTQWMSLSNDYDRLIAELGLTCE